MALATNEFLGKVALVTGSSSGIGRAIVKALANKGARVTITGRNEKGLGETLQECEDAGLTKDQILCIPGDIADDKICKKLVNEAIAQFGKLDLLVNNAAITLMSYMKDTNMAIFDSVWDINCRSAVMMTKLAIPYLLQTKGNVINISSVAGTNALRHNYHYCMSKAALDHFTRCAALEFADRGVRVNTISPGPIKTPFVNRLGVDEALLGRIARTANKVIPMKRIGDSEDVVNAALFLASDKASYITGTLINVDGGLSKVSAKLMPK